MTTLKPILRVIDLVGDGRSMTLPIHPKVIARTHCVRFMDTYNGAEATIFMAADGWLMMRRVGNVWVWPPSEDVQAGAMLYAIGELVECNEEGEPVARQVPISVDEAIRAVGLDLEEAIWAVGLAAFEGGVRSPTHNAAEVELKVAIEAEFDRRIATATSVDEAIDAVAGQMGCRAGHRDEMISALRTAITAHVDAEVARRLEVAPSVKEAMFEFGAAVVEDAVGGHHAPSSRVVAALAGAHGAIAADRERAIRDHDATWQAHDLERDAEVARWQGEAHAAVLFAIGACHDGSDLWAHMKRDPDAFRRTVSSVLSGKIKPMPSPDEARRLVEEYGNAVVECIPAIAAGARGDGDAIDAMAAVIDRGNDARKALLRALGVEA